MPSYTIRFTAHLLGLSMYQSPVKSMDERFKTTEERSDGIDYCLGKAEALLTTFDNEIQVAKTEQSNLREETFSRLDALEVKRETIQKSLDTATFADNEQVDHLSITNRSLNISGQRLKLEQNCFALS